MPAKFKEVALHIHEVAPQDFRADPANRIWTADFGHQTPDQTRTRAFRSPGSAVRSPARRGLRAEGLVWQHRERVPAIYENGGLARLEGLA